MQLRITESRIPFSSILLIAPFFLWGTAMVVMKGVMTQTTPLFLAGVRLLPAGVLVLLAAALMGRSQPRGWKSWLWILLFALVDGTLFQGFLAEGLARTGAGLGSVMIDSQPLAVALLALWIFGERVGLWGWIGLAIGIIGISLLGLPEAWVSALLSQLVHTPSLLVHGLTGKTLSSLPAQLWPALQALFQNGQWLMLLAALSMALGTVISRLVSKTVDPVVATGWHMILGGIPLFLGSVAWESNQVAALEPTSWLALGYSTVFGSAIAYGLFFYFAASGSLTSLSALTFLTPVFALTFGNLFLSETLSSVQWIGVCLTIVSIYLINQRDQLGNLWNPATPQEESDNLLLPESSALPLSNSLLSNRLLSTDSMGDPEPQTFIASQKSSN